MHSIRIRTVRCSSHHRGGGCLPGGCLPAGGGVSACQGGVCLAGGDGVSAWQEGMGCLPDRRGGGVWLPGEVSACQGVSA